MADQAKQIEELTQHVHMLTELVTALLGKLESKDVLSRDELQTMANIYLARDLVPHPDGIDGSWQTFLRGIGLA